MTSDIKLNPAQFTVNNQMRPSISVATALAILSAAIVEAAPAPAVVTVYDTAVQAVTSTAAPFAAPVPSAVASPVASSVPTAASSGSGSSLWSSILSFFDGDSSSTTSSNTASASLSSGSSGFGGLLGSLLSNSKVKSWLSDFGYTSGSSSSSSSAAPVASTQPTTTSAVPFFSVASTTSTSSTSSSASTLSSGSGSGGIYSEIGPSGVDADFAKLILDIHNKYRAAHGAGPLSWDTLAYEYAQNNADSYDCSGILTHTHGQFGENLACGFKDGPSAVTAWYDEGQTYNYQTANEYNHFTQVVWKGSTKMGCAIKDCSKNNWGHYVVCEYDPPGNVIGRNAQNVLQN